jgi:hypothetical protein
MKRPRARRDSSHARAGAALFANVAPTVEAAPPVPGRSWRAEIAWEQAEGSSRFTAVARRGQDASRAVVAASSWQDWPPEGDAVDTMAAAVARLERQLLKAGWIPDGAGAEWYAKRFRWLPASIRAAAAGGPDDPQRPAARERGQTIPADEVGVPADAGVAPEAGAAAPKRVVEDVWRCEIGWEAHTLSSRFVAQAWPPHGQPAREIAHSRPLKWTFKKDPESRRLEHLSAARDLYAAMLDAGWKAAGHGTHWYSARLVWPGPGDPPGLVVDDALAPLRPQAAARGSERAREHDAATVDSSRDGREARSDGSGVARAAPWAPPRDGVDRST